MKAPIVITVLVEQRGILLAIRPKGQIARLVLVLGVLHCSKSCLSFSDFFFSDFQILSFSHLFNPLLVFYSMIFIFSLNQRK